MPRLSLKPFILCAIISLIALPGRAADVPLVTGKQWTQASEEEKRAFLVGVANIVSVEYEVRRDDRRTRPSVIHMLITGLQPMTLTDISKAIDSYYAAHPDQASRAVIEIMVTDIAEAHRPKN